MDIRLCEPKDLPAIQALYQAARNLQTERTMVVWPSFTDAFLLEEIKASRQFALEIDETIACNWAITYADKEIWGDKDLDDSIYIHRLCNHPAYRGHRFIHDVVEWAKAYARAQSKRYIRLDTLGQNDKLIQHYTSAGFTFLGIHQLSDTAALPKHYQDEPNCCLFELVV